jgi:hypothetical protein
MAKLKIPSEEYAVLKKLAELPEETFSSFLSALQDIEPKIVELDLSRLSKLVTEKVASIPAVDAKAFIRTLSALSAIKDSRARPVDDIIGDLQETIESDKAKEFPSDKMDALGKRLTTFLKASSGISLVAKAISVIHGQDRIYCGAKILSDLRPIFRTSPDEVSAAVVIHTLNISYHQDGEHKEFYAAMSPSELGNLKEVIERAEKKSRALKAYVQRSGIRYLEDTE